MKNTDFLENQIDRRRRFDDETFQDAMSDLLGILNVKTRRAASQAKDGIERILRYFGKEVPEVPESVTELDARLEYMLRPSGIMRRRVELIGSWWKDTTGCLLASTKSGEIIALIQSNWGSYEYVDRHGNFVKINAKTAKDINVDAFCFYRPFPQKKLKIRDLLMFMVKTLSVSDVVFVVGVMLIMQLLGMLGPYTTRLLYDTVVPSNSTSLLYPITFFLIGTTIGSTLMGISKNIIDGRLQTKLTLSVNSAIMMRMFSLPAKFFTKYSSGELADKIGGVSQLCQYLMGIALGTIIPTIFSLGYVSQMTIYAPTLVVPGMTVVFALIAFTVVVTLMQQSYLKKKLELQPKFQSLVYALFGGIQKIKIAGAEKRAFAKWAEKYSELANFSYAQPSILQLRSVFYTVISGLGTIAIYYFAGLTGVSNADYTAFYSAYGIVSAALISLGNVVLELATIKPTLDLIAPIMEETPETSESKKIVTSLSGAIEINNVRFRYEEKGPWILDNLSLKIKKGEYLAIVGKTGCGKSTLLRLLLGFEKPERGGVYYDGRDLNSMDAKSIRQKIGVVMQNGALFPGDIFSNIIVTSPWKTLTDAWEAAKMAGVDEDIKAMPMGMNTLISEGGGGISGGQKQRLMIARALVSKPSILFFDEATSALDNITQNHVVESISQLNCTRVVIAHRLSTIKNCDRIVCLDNGKIVEEGNFEELMAKKGFFYSLAIRQIAEPDDENVEVAG